ncbi:hypothetical protein SMICM17S_04179 [Streptomyces microflavus]
MCMPNAGLPILTKDGAHFPLGPDGLADSQETFVRDYGLSLIGGCCGTTPAHMKAVVERARGLTPGERNPRRARRGLPLPDDPLPPGHRVPGHR